jgi:hypothetical protein
MPTFVLPAVGTPEGHRWDEIVFGTTAIGTVTFPPKGAALGAGKVKGKVEVKCKKGRALESKRTGGKDGHRIIDNGLKPAEIRIVLTAWEQDGLNALAQLSEAFQPNKRITDRSPIEIHHPTTAFHKVDKIVVSTVSGPEPTGVAGMFAITIDAMEFTPPAKRKNGVTHTVVAAPLAPGLIDAYGGAAQPASVRQRADQFNHTPNLDP